jgi:hypothetical protein
MNKQNQLPSDPYLGEMVAYSNRVIMVWVGTQWYMLGGEHLSLEGYTRAVNYLIDAWGEGSSTIEHDLDSILTFERDSYFKEVLIQRSKDANDKIISYAETSST